MKLAGMDIAEVGNGPGLRDDRGSRPGAGGRPHGRARADVRLLLLRHCKKTFAANPSRYASGAGSAVSPTPATVPPPGRRRAARDGRRPRTELPDYLRRGDEDLNTTVSAAATGRTIFATDPVCGAEVDTTAPDAITSEFKGKRYYFCLRRLQGRLRQRTRQVHQVRPHRPSRFPTESVSNWYQSTIRSVPPYPPSRYLRAIVASRFPRDISVRHSNCP